MRKIKFEVYETISGLDLPFMSDFELANYNRYVEEFIETMPDKSRELIHLFTSANYSLLLRKLDDELSTLDKIHANYAKEKCLQIISKLKDSNVEKSEIDALLGKYISEISTLSIDIQVAQYQMEETQWQRAGKSTEERKHIFAVDDVPLILNTLKGVIDGKKYKFSGITSGKAALHYLDTRAACPDLFILDIEMPEMDGYMLAMKIKERAPDVPIVFLTSNATREAVVSAIQVGAVDFIVKPINENIILKKLDKYLAD